MKVGEYLGDEGNHQVEVDEQQVEEDDHQVEDEHHVANKEQMAVLSVLLAGVCEKVNQVTLEKHQMGAPYLQCRQLHVQVHMYM